MARNEEKQYGRLNRLHLQKQKDEETRKNPVRPKLHMLHSAEMIRKWLPTISRDLDLRCKQLAVPCYPKIVIDDINRQISALKAEYRAFVNKLRLLEPDVVITDHRYRSHLKRSCDAAESECPVVAKQAVSESVSGCDPISPSSPEENETESSKSSTVHTSLARISLPLLSGSVEAQYRTQQIAEIPTVVWNCDGVECDKPLQLRQPGSSKQNPLLDCDRLLPIDSAERTGKTCVLAKSNAFDALITAYDDGAEEQ